MNKRFFTAVIILFIFFSSKINAQEPLPYYNDIQRFHSLDSATFPASGQILFIGSSSFTIWKDVNDYFPGYNVLNRAFGGSRIVDLIRYRYDVIFPYAPRQIVMYCGENDFASPDKPAVDEVVGRFETLYRYIRQKYPQTPFLYVSMKPSVARKDLTDKFREANNRIKSFLQNQPHTAFADTFSAMLDKNGNVMTDIFIQDNLHMNAKGYAIWQKVLKPYLIKKK